MIDVYAIDEALDVRAAATPPTLSESLQRAVDGLWNAARARRPSLHDGSLFSVARRTDDRIVGSFVPYRHWIAQRADPTLADVLRVQPLAVTGLTRVDGGVLLGKRARDTTQDPGCWELVPSGGLDETSRGDGDCVLPQKQLLAELNEELNVSPGWVTSATPCLLVHDRLDGVWDIVFDMVLRASFDIVHQSLIDGVSTEVQDLVCLAGSKLEAFLEDTDNVVAPVSCAILGAVL